MTQKERGFLAFILAIILMMMAIDLITDSGEGVPWWHLAVEGLVVIVAGVGIGFLLQGSFVLRRKLEAERTQVAGLRADADKWRAEAKRHIEGLGRAIDLQLNQWSLTAAEKEVALLLLKGLSLKEIAEVRHTSEKTVRAHSVAIYSKAGLGGRSELAAFFLEDLLQPQQPQQPAPI